MSLCNSPTTYRVRHICITIGMFVEIIFFNLYAFILLTSTLVLVVGSQSRLPWCRSMPRDLQFLGCALDICVGDQVHNDILICFVIYANNLYWVTLLRSFIFLVLSAIPNLF